MSAIVHLVMWKLNGASVPERQAQGQLAVQAFEALRGQVPGLLRMEVGGNVIEADNTHPAHQAIKVLMRPMRQSRAQVDFETSS
jgi:Stress responsive A/B Barrel Domain